MMMFPGGGFGTMRVEGGGGGGGNQVIIIRN
jgi:hypothetical protein